MVNVFLPVCVTCVPEDAMYFCARDDKAIPETLAWTEHLENRSVFANL